jgi:hypothetical protein
VSRIIVISRYVLYSSHFTGKKIVAVGEDIRPSGKKKPEEEDI